MTRNIFLASALAAAFSLSIVVACGNSSGGGIGGATSNSSSSSGGAGGSATAGSTASGTGGAKHNICLPGKDCEPFAPADAGADVDAGD